VALLIWKVPPKADVFDRPLQDRGVLYPKLSFCAEVGGNQLKEINQVTELQALYEIVPWQEFQPKERLVLNPVFGEGSRLLGGADADLVLDEQLIEIKTVPKQTLTLETVRQLVGYALLANKYGVNGDGRDDTILRLGVYYSRTGMLHRFALGNCIDAENDHDVLNFLLSFSGLSLP